MNTYFILLKKIQFKYSLPYDLFLIIYNKYKDYYANIIIKSWYKCINRIHIKPIRNLLYLLNYNIVNYSFVSKLKYINTYLSFKQITEINKNWWEWSFLNLYINIYSYLIPNHLIYYDSIQEVELLLYDIAYKFKENNMWYPDLIGIN